MRSRSAAVLVVLLVLATGAGSVGAATAHTAALTPAETAWFKPVASEYTALAKALDVVGQQEIAKNALDPGTTANKALLTTLATFVGCKSVLSKAGKPPTTRLEPFYKSMKSACGRLYTGGNTIAKGIGEVEKGSSSEAIALLKQGTAQLKEGSTLLGTAAKQAVAVGGSSNGTGKSGSPTLKS